MHYFVPLVSSSQLLEGMVELVAECSLVSTMLGVRNDAASVVSTKRG